METILLFGFESKAFACRNVSKDKNRPVMLVLSTTLWEFIYFVFPIEVGK